MAQANPQEKQIYDMIVKQAVGFLHQKEQAMKLDAMAHKGNPAEAVATFTAAAIKSVMQAAAQAGHQLSMRFIIPAAKEVIIHVVETLVQMGSIEKQQARQVSQQAQQIFSHIVGGQ